MPIFSSQLGKIESQTPEAGIHSLANHIRKLQEELEYRLANLDSSNITEIVLEDTNMTMGGEPLQNVVGDSAGNVAALQQDVTGLASTVASQGSSITSLQQTSKSLSASVTNLQEGTATMLYMDDDGLIVSNQDGKSVMISGDQLKAGTVMADQLIGGEVHLLSDELTPLGVRALAGTLSITGADTGDFAVDLYSNGAMRFVASYGDIWIEEKRGGAAIGLEEEVFIHGNLIPGADEYYDIGRETEKWNDIWAANSEIQTSDRNEKHDIRYDLSAYDGFFDGLQPVIYKLNDGTSDRDHVGLIAQDVEQDLDDNDLEGKDFAGFVKFQKKDGSYGYGLRYGEFIGLLIKQVQDLKARVAELEAKHGQTD